MTLLEPISASLAVLFAIQGEVDRPSVHAVEADAARGALVDYAWEGELALPSTARSQPVTVAFGEAGLRPDTRLYLPFNEGDGATTRDVARPIAVHDVAPAAWGAGRFGAGVVFRGEETGLTLDASADVFQPPWTLELWVRPSTQGALVTVPGAFTLRVDETLRCAASFEGSNGASFTVQSEAALVQDAWNHVALVHDRAPGLKHTRLVANGAVTGTVHPDGWSSGVGDGLRIGAGFTGTIDDLHVEARAAMSSELIERSEARPRPGATRLSLRYEDGQEDVELWRDWLTTPVPDASAIASSGDLRQVVADDAGLRWVPAHWERDRATSAPTARTTHPTIPVGDGRVFVFGGETRDSHFYDWHNTNDTWLYDTRTRAWKSIDTDTAPPPTCHQGAAYSPDHGYVLYFGGARNDQGPEPITYRGTWAFHVDEGRWEELTTIGQAPPGAGCAVVYFPPLRSFIAIRGKRLIVFEPDSRTWLPLPPAKMVDERGEPVDHTFGGSMMAGYDPESGQIVLFGGEVYDEEGGAFFDRTALVHVPSNTIVIRDPSPAPSARVRSGFAYDPTGKQFVLFGGVLGQFSQRFGDLWTYRVAEDRWTPLESSNTPTERGGYYGMAYEPEVDAFFLLCGRHAPTRFLNEAWRLLIRPDEPGTAEFGFDRASFEDGLAWFVDWDGPEGAAVTATFRGSDDGARWTAPSSEPGTSRFLRVRLELVPNPDGATPTVRSFGFR